MNVRKVDVLFEKIGDPGKFQLISYLCMLTNIVIGMSNYLSSAFFAAKTRHHCKLGSSESVTDLIPIVVNRHSERVWDGCHVYSGNNTNITIPCRNGWTYYLEDNEATIIAEFNLVCDDAYKSDLSSTIFFAGVMFSALSLGYFADKYGRRYLIGILLLLTGALSLALFFSKGFVAFTIIRFCLGFTIQGVSNIAFVLVLELFQTKYRALAAVCFGVGAVSGGGVLALFAYLLRDWRYIQLALSILPFIQFLMLWFVPESLRWLLLKRKFKQAEAVIGRIATFNNLPFPRKIFDEIKQSCDQESGNIKQHHKAGFTDLVKNQTLRNRTLLLAATWSSIASAYYGLAFNISFLFGNKYLNFGISQVVDMCGVLFMAWITPRLGRRKPLAYSYFLCGLANIICLITKLIKSDSNIIQIIGTVAALLGKACAQSCLIVLYTFTTELYPTVIRNISLGINSFWGRVGSMAAPQILLLGVYTSDAVPYSIFGLLTFLSGFLILLLPETHNKALMDTIEHTNDFINYDKVIVRPESESDTMLPESDSSYNYSDQFITSV